MLGAPDTILLYAVDPGAVADWQRTVFPRVVDFRLAHDDFLAENYEARAYLPLGGNGAGYIVLRRTRP
jgi:hypothetical protein